MNAAEGWRHRLRANLTVAMKARDMDAVSALRGAMAAIDNAEAVAVVVPEGAGPPSSGAIAGATAGIGSTEVSRRNLSFDAVRDVVLAQIDDRDAAADWSDAHGHGERAERLRREAVALRTVVSGMPEPDGRGTG